jgi:dihydrofolate reductase
MSELVIDFITSLDGYASAEGWPGWWGLEGPEYLAWLGERPDRDYTLLMGANTYRVMYSFAAEPESSNPNATPEEDAATSELTKLPKVVFSSTLDAPLPWENTRLVTGEAVEEVAAMKRDGTNMSTIGSLSLCRSLLKAGLVDRYRVVVFPVITGSTGRERIYDAYPDVALDMVDSRTFDGRIQLLEYVPTILSGPPGTVPFRGEEAEAGR